MLYRITLKQLSEIVGPVTANTLFGAFLTAYSSCMQIGETEIRDIILSDLFPAGVLPVGVKDNHTLYNKVAPIKTTITMRTLIARNTGIDNVPNQLSAYTYNGRWEFYLSTRLLDAQSVQKIIEVMLTFGIGKWRNCGKGHFRLVNIEKYDDVNRESQKIALSNFVPTSDVDGITETGYTIRSAIATNGRKQQSVCMLLSGTKLITKDNCIGDHVYDKTSDTYIHGKAILLEG